jgi:hypothetical protein
MKISDQLTNLVAVLPKKEPPVSTRQEDDPDLVWMWRLKVHALARN